MPPVTHSELAWARRAADIESLANAVYWAKDRVGPWERRLLATKAVDSTRRLPHQNWAGRDHTFRGA